MSEWKKLKKEQDWTEDADAEAQDGGYEKTYRDGSAVNECWAEDREHV